MLRSKATQAFARLATSGAVSLLLLFFWAGWALSARSVSVTVDGIHETVRTHRHTVGALLLDVGILIQPNDRVTPAPSSTISRGMSIAVERARPYRILADGRETLVTSWGATVAEELADAGGPFERHDRILIGDQQVAPTDSLPAPEVSVAPQTYDQGFGWARLSTAPRLLRLHRAIPITVDDGTLPYVIRTTATTVGEALRGAEITIYLGDRVQPSLGSQVSAGLRIFIERSTPVALQVDGRLIKTRTRAKTVADALTELKIGVAGADRVSPALEDSLTDNLLIDITRIREEVAIKEQIIPFETVFEPDSNLAIDTQQVVNSGAPGINRQRYRVQYENGEETERTLQDSWVAQEATQRVIAYGQLIEPQTLTLQDGSTITYWRKFRAYASSYSAATAGVSRDSPSYGHTFTGEKMRNGIVAVDPRLIPLRSQMYVPGYGVGDALDTGSAIIGRHIDLGYNDDELVMWTRWVDVYLLWPPPPAYQIAWVLPNYPREPN
ncbi:MAG TPA: ubiquitin-like domain-containing protein [Caldilineaceae bacterium]|nr:ubiquitin-like domain-containing protein [Caldilineaceae bacterium]